MTQYEYDQEIDQTNETEYLRLQSEEKDLFPEEREVYPDVEETLSRWINESYTSNEVRLYPWKDTMLYCIHDMGHETRATMHGDDPSLIMLFDELDKIIKLLK